MFRLKILLFIFFLGVLLPRDTDAEQAKCYDQNVLSYFYNITVPVENANGMFVVPGSINSDEAQVRLFGEPTLPWQRHNLWVKDTRRERYEEALIEIVTLANYPQAKRKELQKKFLELAPYPIKNSQLYTLLNEWLDADLDVNQSIDSLSQSFSTAVDPIALLIKLKELADLYDLDEVPQQISLFQGTEFAVYSSPGTWYQIKQWISPIADAAKKIQTIGTIMNISNDFYKNVLITSIWSALMSNNASYQRLLDIKTQLQSTFIWSDPAFQEALLNVEAYLMETQKKSTIYAIIEGIGEEIPGLLTDNIPLAISTFGPKTIGIINSALGSPLCYSAAAGWALGIQALAFEFKIILGIENQLENSELSVASATIAYNICMKTGNDCELKVPAMYGYLASARYVIEAFDYEPLPFWNIFNNWDETVVLWEDAANYFETNLDYEFNEICDSIPPDIVITSPNDLSEVSIPLAVNIVVNDNNDVSSVSLYVNGAFVEYMNFSDSFHLSTQLNNTSLQNGINHIEIIAIDEFGNQSSEEISVILTDSDTGGVHSNVAPVINIISPADQSEPVVADGFRIKWLAYDPDNNASIVFHYDNDIIFDNGTAGIITALFEDEADSYFWDITQVVEGVYYIVARISDGINAEVVQYSIGTVNVQHPDIANDLELTSPTIWQWDDDKSGNNQEYINGIPEGLESLEVYIPLRNKSSRNLQFVHATLSSSASPIDFSSGDDFVNYGNFVAGESKIPDDDFGFRVTSSYYYNTPFVLHLEYEDTSGNNYIQNLSFNFSFPVQGSAVPNLFSGTIQIDDSGLRGDGDGIFESGESVKFWVPLSNTGSAACVNPQGIIRQETTWGSNVFSDTTNNYPDIQVGETQNNNFGYDTYDAPENFAGDIDVSMTVWYGPDRDKSQEVPFTITVSPVSYITIAPQSYDFGLVSPGTPIIKELTITNYGSGNLIINTISPNNTDTNITGVSLPLTISPGSSTTMDIELDTTQMNGFVTRTITVNSNSYNNINKVFTITGTITNIDSEAAYQKIGDIEIVTNDGPFNNVTIGDTDNDGNPEIIATTGGANLDSIPYPGKLYIYEKTGDDIFQLKWTSENIGQIRDTNGLAIGDFDGDGYDDIVVLAGSNYISSNPLPYKVSWFEATGNDTWTSRGTPVTDSSDWLLSLDVGDSDNDGSLEIVVSRRGISGDDPRVLVYEYSGGSFPLRWTSPQIMNSYDDIADNVLAVTIADSDSDGNNEIIFSTDSAQIYIFERTGNDSYSQRLRYDNEDWLGTGELIDIIVADTDNDGKKEIIYTSDEGYLFILESTGNDSWNTFAPEHYDLPSIEGHSLLADDIDNDGEIEIVIGGYVPNICIYETIADNSHVLAWESTDAEVADEVHSMASLNINQTPEKEIIATTVDNYIVVLAYQNPVDLQIIETNISFEPNSPLDNGTTMIEAIIQNLSTTDLQNVFVRFYEGDPDNGGIKIGTDEVITSIPGNDSALVQKSWQPVAAQNYTIFIVVDPDSVYDTKDTTNNKASKSVEVLDNDLTGPSIINITIIEYNGDGDGLIEDNEEVKISWSAYDYSGISASYCNIAETEYHPSDNYYVIVGPFEAGEYQYTIYATDGDNSQETTSLSGGINVIPHAPLIIDTSPINNENNVLLLPTIRAILDIDLNPSTINETTVLLVDSDLDEIPGEITYSSSNREITFNPSHELESSMTYTLILKSGTDGILDENGNQLEEDYIWFFTTEADIDAPISIISSPADVENIRGVIDVFGTAWDKNFDNYQILYGVGLNPSTWAPITDQISDSVTSNLLASWDTTAVPDGNYCIKLTSVDQVPALNESSDTITVFVDNTVPIVTISTDGGNGIGMDFSTSQSVVIIEGSVTDSSPSSGLASVNISDTHSNEGSLSAWRFTVTLSEGDNIITVRAADNSGNIGEDSIIVTKQGEISLVGDFNSDGIVNYLDLGLFADHWLFVDDDPDWDPKFNLSTVPDDGKQIINYLDLGIFADHWLEESP